MVARGCKRLQEVARGCKRLLVKRTQSNDDTNRGQFGVEIGGSSWEKGKEFKISILEIF